MIISGPNAGGKTVSLKTIGLIVMMNQCGLAVPAYKATLGFFKNIYIDIGDNQSLSDNLSTFSAHMYQIGEITQLVKGKDLVLIDELGTGTDPKEGEALAYSIVKYLESRHCLAMISSHFSALKEYAFVSPHIDNSSMIFDEDNLLPTYKFRQGTPGMSYALDVASRYGISLEIVDEAKKFISESSQNDANELISVLQQKLDQTNKLEIELNRRKKEIENLEKKIANDEKLLKGQREKLLENVNEEKRQILEDAKEQVEEVLSALSKDGTKLHEIIELKKKIEDLEDSNETISYNEEIMVNDYVSIPSLNMSGRVIQIKGERAKITSEDGLPFEVSKDKLHKIEAPKTKTVKKSVSNVDFALSTNVGLEINLIGMHVEEAQNALIKYLDNCRMRHLKQVRVIHGFGSGALRKMTREYLDKQSDLTYRAGDGSEGGGGATVVIFK